MIARVVVEAVEGRRRELIGALDACRSEYLKAVSGRDQAAQRAATYLAKVEGLQAQLDEIAAFLATGRRGESGSE